MDIYLFGYFPITLFQYFSLLFITFHLIQFATTASLHDFEEYTQVVLFQVKMISRKYIPLLCRINLKCFFVFSLSAFLFSSFQELCWHLQRWREEKWCLQDQPRWLRDNWCVLWPNNSRRGVVSVPEETQRFGEFLPRLGRIQTWLWSADWWILHVDLEDFHEKSYYAEYDSFKVASEGEKYTLSLENYSGLISHYFSFQIFDICHW